MLYMLRLYFIVIYLISSFGMIDFHVNARVESIAVNLNLWVCMCFVTSTPMIYNMEYCQTIWNKTVNKIQ